MPPRVLYAAAPWWAGVRHRFRSLNQARTFARYAGYRIHFLWGVSDGVGYCRFEELFASVPGVGIINIPERELVEVEQRCRTSKAIDFSGQSCAVYRPGDPLSDKLIAFDLVGDLAATTALQRLTPPEFHEIETARAAPSAELRDKAQVFTRRHGLTTRIGIRVRVTENPRDGRKPRRLQRDLDRTVQSIIRMPWHVRVFLVTDSEYIQQMVASHFHDACFFSKKFLDSAEGGRYIQRRDRSDMRTFMTEIACLAVCWKIINIGGFVNEESLWSKLIYPPYDRALLRAPSSR